jgi:hypothetical protein
MSSLFDAALHPASLHEQSTQFYDQVLKAHMCTSCIEESVDGWSELCIAVPAVRMLWRKSAAFDVAVQLGAAPGPLTQNAVLCCRVLYKPTTAAHHKT